MNNGLFFVSISKFLVHSELRKYEKSLKIGNEKMKKKLCSICVQPIFRFWLPEFIIIISNAYAFFHANPLVMPQWALCTEFGNPSTSHYVLKLKIHRFYKTLQGFVWYITMSSNIFLRLLMILLKLTPFLPIFSFTFFEHFAIFW